jgi:DNA-binding response OmpR family regulator
VCQVKGLSLNERCADASPARILLVDDDADTARVLGVFLEKNHYSVDAFTDPKAALSHFSAGLYQLALIDVRMKNLTGFQLYERLIDVDPLLKVCFITAAEPSEFAEFQKKHQSKIKFEQLLRKPIDPDDLLATLKRLSLET